MIVVVGAHGCCRTRDDVQFDKTDDGNKYAAAADLVLSKWQSRAEMIDNQSSPTAAGRITYASRQGAHCPFRHPEAVTDVESSQRELLF